MQIYTQSPIEQIGIWQINDFQYKNDLMSAVDVFLVIKKCKVDAMHQTAI